MFCLIELPRTPSKMLKRGGKRKNPCLIFGLRGKVFLFSWVKSDDRYRFLTHVLYQVGNLPYSYLAESSYHEWVLTFARSF